MADALTNFGLLYAAKEDAKLEAQVQSSLQIAQMNVLAQERAVQARIEAEERRDQTRLKPRSFRIEHVSRPRSGWSRGPNNLGEIILTTLRINYIKNK